MISVERFYTAPNGPLKQGDILLAGTARIIAADRFTPSAWEHLDEHYLEIQPSSPERPALNIAAGGPTLVMATSHDCHFDKEWNRRRNELIKQGATEDEASRQAEEDRTLDRTFTASPLIDPDDINIDQGNLKAGRVVGYLPVPANPATYIDRDAVVDLGYRVTLDRLDVRRLASVSHEVRTQLRYGLARLDSLRSTEIGFKLEEVIGKNITEIEFPRTSPLAVRLLLDDGNHIELLQKPADPEAGPSRQSFSGT